MRQPCPQSVRAAATSPVAAPCQCRRGCRAKIVCRRAIGSGVSLAAPACEACAAARAQCARSAVCARARSRSLLPACLADAPRQHRRRQPHAPEARALAVGRHRQRAAEPAGRLVEAAARQRQQLVGRGQRAGRAAQRLALAVEAARRAGAAAARARLASVASSSAFTGTAISAAPVGVGARMSATKSISVQSVSWPTAEITGMPDAATARASASSLKPQRSSRLPPPRATISTSGPGDRPAGGKRVEAGTAAVASAPDGLALHAHRPDQDMHREAVLDAVDDVADDGAGRRGHDADDARHEGQAAACAPARTGLRRRACACAPRAAPSARRRRPAPDCR